MQRLLSILLVVTCGLHASTSVAAPLQAGVGKADITDRQHGPVNDPLYAKALVLKQGETAVVLITIDAVAIGEIGRIGNDFLSTVRKQIQDELGVPPGNVLINASHCHGVVRRDTAALTVQAVKQAWQAVTPVRVGVASGQEPRISENRRLHMKDGSEVDMRRAYALPADKDVAAVGPIDPQVGVLRLDRQDGRPLAVLYNFACHPIMGVPGGGNTADFPGFASRVVEDFLGHGAMAFFVQGCAGDINPVRYKTVTQPPDAEPLGNLLGLTVVRTCKQIKPADDATLRMISQSIDLPRATDYGKRIAAIEDERVRLLSALRPTDINFKTFLPLYLQHNLSPDTPSYYAQGYLHDKALGRAHLAKLDAKTRAGVQTYLRNIQIMEKLTRLNTNLRLLRNHQARTVATDGKSLTVEMAGLRIGAFRLITFPGELTVQVGLNLKKRSPHQHTYIAGYTNGYIYYTPTAKQRGNTGYAQEDCDCLVDPAWQKIFEAKALDLLKRL